MTTNLQVRVRTLPSQGVEPGHFELRETALPRPATGEVLVRNHFLSLDPYMRKRLTEAAAGRVQFGPGDLMMGRTVGVVVESHDPAFRAGDQVLGWGGWQHYSAEPAARLEKVEPVNDLPLSVHLGVLGRPGITAWLGVVHVAALQAGERFLVSSAAGAVGSLAGQIARHLGGDVVGVAGGPPSAMPWWENSASARVSTISPRSSTGCWPRRRLAGWMPASRMWALRCWTPRSSA
jgi:NADPH-dependent curcumin reductase CurA